VGCITSPAINVSFNDGNQLLEVAFDKFTETPRSYVSINDLAFSVAGSAIQSGNSRANRQTWAIASYVDSDTAHTLDEIYRRWDVMRAAGGLAVLGVVDQTFVRNINQPVRATAVFTASPTFDKRDTNLWLAAFGMTEI